MIKENPAKAVKPPKVTQTPTLPFSRDDMKRMVKTCGEYGGNKERMKAFVLTMRYTGLRLGDAIRLSKTHVADGRVFVRTAKPDNQLRFRFLQKWSKPSGKWRTGLTDTSGRARTSDRLFPTGRAILQGCSLAEVKDAHSHCFRDTCAVELLLAGASVEDVASILGNTPQVVAKHYAPWVRERQERLEKLVHQSWR